MSSVRIELPTRLPVGCGVIGYGKVSCDIVADDRNEGYGVRKLEKEVFFFLLGYSREFCGVWVVALGGICGSDSSQRCTNH